LPGIPEETQQRHNAGLPGYGLAKLGVISHTNYMQIRLGYELIYTFPQPTPMILTLSIHYSRASDIIIPDYLTTDPSVPIGGYRDGFGNWCTRLVAPAGRIRIKTAALIRDTGKPDGVFPNARQHAVEDLPEETLVFLLGSRYCETDLLSQAAWDMFGQSQPGWARVQAICDYVHNRIAFDYQKAQATRTAWEAFNTCIGVCRDYAHLAIAFCRCLNIPARYCTGYLGDMGTQPPYGVGDFAAWFEVYLGGGWHTFDARNNVPRIGRVLLARGRDASDVAIATTFGANTLESFKVWTDDTAEAIGPVR
jgi:transglutaminase-like putative cysteine protease